MTLALSLVRSVLSALALISCVLALLSRALARASLSSRAARALHYLIMHELRSHVSSQLISYVVARAQLVSCVLVRRLVSRAALSSSLVYFYDREQVRAESSLDFVNKRHIDSRARCDFVNKRHSRAARAARR